MCDSGRVQDTSVRYTQGNSMLLPCVEGAIVVEVVKVWEGIQREVVTDRQSGWRRRSESGFDVEVRYICTESRVWSIA
jgi:hypothetical protein